MEDKVIKCLDHGFVRLVDSMGGDSSIVQAARVSYGSGTKTLREDAALINYLYRNEHTTPFEMVEFKFHCKMPIFVARQWIRQRTASVNEYSARYSKLDNEFYLPEIDRVGCKPSDNKQGTGNIVDQLEAITFINRTKDNSQSAYEVYEQSLFENPHDDLPFKGVARELARINLPVNFYTQWYWKIDLHNLLKFLSQRLNPHAQYEIRVYAEAMASFVKAQVPYAWEAFEEHKLYAKTFSRKQLDFLKTLITEEAKPKADHAKPDNWSQGEWSDFIKNFS